MSFGWFSISVPDAAGTDSNTAAYVDDARARALAAKARISRHKLLAAYKARFDETRYEHVLAALRPSCVTSSTSLWMYHILA
jgi:hypothetical protein